MARKKAPQGSSPSEAVVPPTNPPRPKPLVFVSHDTRDAEIAEAFSNLLQDASGGVLRSFRSSDRKGTSGIEFGAEWYGTIMDRLKDATDVVALLTELSVGRPWLLYEAGVAKGKLDTVVFGLAIGIPLATASVGPFAQFQNSADDEDSLTKLVLQLIRRNPDADPREEAVRRQVLVFRETAARILSTRRGSANTSPSQPQAIDPSAVAKLFEEVKIMFRQLPDQLERMLELRMRDVPRRSLVPRIGPDVINKAYERLVSSRFGDGATVWRELGLIARTYFPELYPGLQSMRSAWGKGDPEQIARASDILLSEIAATPSHRTRFHESQYPEASYVADLPVMLSHFLRRLELPGQASVDREKPVPQTTTKSSKESK